MQDFKWALARVEWRDRIKVMLCSLEVSSRTDMIRKSIIKSIII